MTWFTDSLHQPLDNTEVAVVEPSSLESDSDSASQLHSLRSEVRSLREDNEELRGIISQLRHYIAENVPTTGKLSVKRENYESNKSLVLKKRLLKMFTPIK
jgi:hypothetical protein